MGVHMCACVSWVPCMCLCVEMCSIWSYELLFGCLRTTEIAAAEMAETLMDINTPFFSPSLIKRNKLGHVGFQSLDCGHAWGPSEKTF